MNLTLAILFLCAVSTFAQVPPLPPEPTAAEIRQREMRREHKSITRAENQVVAERAAKVPAKPSPVITNIQPAQQRVIDSVKAAGGVHTPKKKFVRPTVSPKQAANDDHPGRTRP